MIFLGILPVGILFLDQSSKVWILRHPSPREIIPGVLGVRLAKNTGAAFSLFSDQPAVTVLLSGCLLLGLILFLLKMPLTRSQRLCGCMIAAGAFSNLLDRILRGYVVDLIELLFVRFAIFNVADIAVVVGTVLLMLSLFRHKDAKAGVHHG